MRGKYKSRRIQNAKSNKTEKNPLVRGDYGGASIVVRLFFVPVHGRRVPQHCLPPVENA